MANCFHEIVQILMVVFNWITNDVINLVVTVVIIFVLCMLVFIIRVLPYKGYPKNIKVILPKEILRSIEIFFVSLIVLVVLYLGTVLCVNIETYLENMQKLKELQTVYKNINKDYLLADVTVTDIDSDSNLSVDISYYGYGDNQEPINIEQVKISGTTLYIDCYQYNFEYSSIETGEDKNLAIPYRIFSNSVAADKGISLNPYNKDGIPYIFERSENNVWGIEPAVYNERIQELIKIMNDPQKSQIDGILRSSSGSALHFLVQKGITYRMYVSQSGGLTLAKKSGWY